MQVLKKNESHYSSYSKFEKIDGTHPIKKLVKNSYIEYPARIRKGGKVRYFNFELAKEMGLVSQDHNHEMNTELENIILKTFGIIIINEFDQMNGRVFPPSEMKEGTYMATRYLQLQHNDKKGKNSGDGRSLWNGQIKNKGKLWDITSCGTGATRLSPATSKYNKFFESGDPTISYGCGYAEIDEGLAQALFSEVFYKNKVQTERVLAVIEFEKGYAINVRAHENLLRPSHFFVHLKQNDWQSTRDLMDYYIETQRYHLDWHDCPAGEEKYNYFLKKFSTTFAKMAATFEDEYIFCWLDWDGDNILMDGGIIDYGSVRQFGLFHYEYRYDDVDRYSTTIVEQKSKARYIVQTFAQLVDYAQSKNKTPINKYAKHWSLSNFDKVFESQKNVNILNKIGFDEKATDYLLKTSLKAVRNFREIFSHFERTKSRKGLVEVADGVSWDAIFCMRDILRELPQLMMARNAFIEPHEFIDILKSNYAEKEDLKISAYRKKMIYKFQHYYKLLIEKVALHNNKDIQKQLLEISMRSSVINKMERVTGDSISVIVEHIVKKRNKLTSDNIYNLIKDFSELQNINPHATPKINQQTQAMVKQFFNIVKEYREGL